MYYLIFYFSGLLFNPTSASSLYSDSSQEDLTRSNVDLQSIRNALQLIARLQQINEQGPKVQAPHKREGRTEKRYQGVDLDYLAFSGEHYLNLNRLMDLVQRNYQAKSGNPWKHSSANPRVYYISNPEVLEEYWKNLKKRVSSESSERESRGSNGAVIETNLLKYLLSLRREGDEKDNDNAEADPEKNKLSHTNHGNLAQEFRGTIGLFDDNAKADPFHDTQSTLKTPSKSASSNIGFKSHDYNDDDSRNRKKSKAKFEQKTPARVQRDDEDIKKSIESFKSAWKVKKERTMERNRGDEERSRNKPPAYNRPKFTVKERLRSNFVPGKNNARGYPPYGRTPVPIVGKRGIYEEE